MREGNQEGGIVLRCIKLKAEFVKVIGADVIQPET